MLLGLALACGQAAVGAPAAGLITGIQELARLAPDPAGTAHPIDLKALVVCCDQGWHQLYLFDGHDTGYLNADDFAVPLEKGQRIELTGLARASNALANLNVVVTGHGELPPALSLSLADLAQAHSQWVQTTGLVLSAEASRGRLALLLNDGSQNCLAYVLSAAPEKDFHRWVGCRVRVRGINASTASNGRLVSPLFFVAGMDQLTLLQPASQRAPIPVVSISSLLDRELGPWTNDWAHVSGLVAAYQPGQFVVLKDPTGTIRARVAQMTEVAGGERVDLWGLLRPSPEGAFLDTAWFELAPAPAVQPAPALLPNANRAGLPPILTHIADIRRLTREQAALQLPVRVHGVLTYADPEWHNAFIQDASGAIYVDLAPAERRLHPGNWVEVIGQTSSGGFAPEVIHSQFRILGTTNLPTPARLDLQDLASGAWDAHWIQMEGVVQRIDTQAGHLTLHVMTPTGRFRVLLPGFENRPPPWNLIDAVVRVRGACTSELNARRQLSGITLHVPDLQAITILAQPPADPFAIPATPIANIATFNSPALPERLTGRRVKIRGVVTLCLPGQGFFLQDDSGGIRVQTPETGAPHPGDLVEALGFPAIGNFSPYLENATLRRVGAQPLPAAMRTTAEQILLSGTNDAQRVQLEGRLLQSVPRAAQPQLVLQDGPTIFTASLEGPLGLRQLSRVQPGSLLRVAGVCSIQGDERHEPVTFKLWLHQPADIRVLSTPPWWTARRAFVVAGTLLLAVALALGWVSLLRRQVRRQTNLLRQKLFEEEALQREILEISNREQRRIGHDLHDGVCQQLAGIALMTSTLADELEEVSQPQAPKAEKISAMLNEVIDQTRGVAQGLFPVQLEEKGLVFALEGLAANAGELFNVQCRFVCEQPPALIQNAVALHLYYIALEAVGNAARHGAPRNISVRLEPAGELFRLSVCDDGAGFVIPRGGLTGMGIRIMRYRAGVIGGSLTLHSQPGQGTSVECLFFPVPPTSPEPAPAASTSPSLSRGVLTPRPLGQS
ncbi:MAG TPA: sensor histidine kinase [Verrucomicrobiae bacterium]|nr:sensor histidine kinase [Verrucomicrobiae bacterium]